MPSSPRETPNTGDTCHECGARHGEFLPQTSESKYTHEIVITIPGDPDLCTWCLRRQIADETYLSEREADIIMLKYAGYNRREIAKVLNITENTVSTVKNRIKDKVQRIRNTQHYLETFTFDPFDSG